MSSIAEHFVTANGHGWNWFEHAPNWNYYGQIIPSDNSNIVVVVPINTRRTAVWRVFHVGGPLCDSKLRGSHTHTLTHKSIRTRSDFQNLVSTINKHFIQNLSHCTMSLFARNYRPCLVLLFFIYVLKCRWI